MTKTLSQANLLQFTGADQWHRHAINRKILYHRRREIRRRPGRSLLAAG